MRILTFYFLFILISENSSGQCPNPFAQSEKFWSQIETTIDPTYKQQLVFAYRNPSMVISNSVEDYVDWYHPVYLNQDTLVDFIYEGYLGGESLFVEFLENRNSRLVPVHKAQGRILNIIRGTLSSGMLVFFEQYGCCDDLHNYIQQWTLVTNDQSIRIYESEKTHYLNQTEIPECFDLSIKFEVLNTPYSLRATPEIVNGEFDYDYNKGNIIAEFGKGDFGIAYAQKEDDTGRVWWFVIMKPTKYQNNFHNYPTYKNGNWAGWMSSRYLRKVGVGK